MRYPVGLGISKVYFPRDKTGLNPREHTIAEHLKEAGYKTKAVGKWHLGHKKAFLPTNQGFDFLFSHNFFAADARSASRFALYLG